MILHVIIVSGCFRSFFSPALAILRFFFNVPMLGGGHWHQAIALLDALLKMKVGPDSNPGII